MSVTISRIDQRRNRLVVLFMALAIAAAAVIASLMSVSAAYADDTIIRPESTSITVTCTSSKEGTINVVSKFNLAPTDTPPNLRTIVNGTDTNIGSPDGAGLYTATVPYDNTQGYHVVVGYVGNDSAYAGYEDFMPGACDGYVDPTPDPTATVSTPVLTYDAAHGYVVISGTSSVENAPDGTSQAVTFTVAGPGSPSASSSPVGAYGSSFPVTQTTAAQDFTVVAQVVVDGKVLAISDVASITIEALSGGGSTPIDPPTSGGGVDSDPVQTPSTPSQPSAPSTPSVGSYFPGAGTDLVSSPGTHVWGVVGFGGLVALASVLGFISFMKLRRSTRASAHK